MSLKQLGSYQIQSVLGQGGMGVVYKARQKQLDRLVALKIMLPQFSRDPAFVERFNRGHGIEPAGTGQFGRGSRCGGSPV